MNALSPADADRLRQAFLRCRDMEGTLGEQLEAYAVAGREIFPAYSQAVDRLVERIHENGGGENAPRPGEAPPGTASAHDHHHHDAVGAAAARRAGTALTPAAAAVRAPRRGRGDGHGQGAALGAGRGAARALGRRSRRPRPGDHHPSPQTSRLSRRQNVRRLARARLLHPAPPSKRSRRWSGSVAPRTSASAGRGTGKSHYAEALGHAAIEHGHTVAWLTLERLAELVSRHRPDDSITRAIARLIRSDLICVDDIGMLPITPDAAEALFRLVDAAYEKRSLIVTSNIHPAGFDELMPKTLATATVDRLLHHAHVVVTRGDSYRLAEATAGKGVKPLT